jgi:hypothetical protein
LQVGIAGTFGGRRMISPNKASRLVITVDVENKKKICAYLDGHLSARMDIATLIPASSNAPYAITNAFSLFSDADSSRTLLRMGISNVQIRDSFLSAREVRLLGRFGRLDLDDGRSVKQVASSLSQMGYPMHWCIKVSFVSLGPTKC